MATIARSLVRALTDPWRSCRGCDSSQQFVASRRRLVTAVDGQATVEDCLGSIRAVIAGSVPLIGDYAQHDAAMMADPRVNAQQITRNGWRVT
jgi:hypothetical protein